MKLFGYAVATAQVRSSPNSPEFFEPLESRLLLSAAAIHATAPAAQASAAVVVPVNSSRPVAVISATPTTGNAPLTVKFDATGSTSPIGRPLHFLWNFGDGTARVRGATTTHTFAQNGVFNVTLIAIDDLRQRTTAREQIGVGASAPTINLILPKSTTTYRPGQVIAFSALATDPAGGVIPVGDYTWTFDLHADGKVKALLHPRVGAFGGSFVVPNITSIDPKQFISVTVTVLSTSGLVGSQSVDLSPATTTLSVQSNIPGAVLKIDGTNQKAPDTLTTVVDSEHRVGAPRRQIINGIPYRFQRWSDRGRITHQISVPIGGRILFAIYRPTSLR